MYRFWDVLIRPLLERTKPGVVVEIGADRGLHTKLLLEFCANEDAVLHSIDPFPKFEVEKLEEKYGRRFAFHRGLSLNALPRIEGADVVLVDGDHNWFTVYNELKILERVAEEGDRPFPLVFLHDVEWPYARRDLYYFAENIPEYYRKPYRREGIRPGESELVPEGGLNRHLCNSIYENQIQNGVLTAAEDFLKETEIPVRFLRFPGIFGIGVVLPERLEASRPEVSEYLRRLEMNETARRYFDLVESQRCLAEVSLSEKNEDFRRLAESKRDALAEQAERIAAIERSHSFRAKESRKRIDALVRAKEELERELGEAKTRNSALAGSVEAARREAEGLREAERRRSASAKKEADSMKRQLQALRKAVERSNAEALRYRGLAETLLRKSSEVLGSKQYGIGRLIGVWGRRLLLRPPTPDIRGQFDRIREKMEKGSGKLRGGAEERRASSNRKPPAAGADRENVRAVAKKTGEKTVSIVVLNKNGAGHLKNLFESFAERNTYGAFEFVVVDHGSEDGSLETIWTYQHRIANVRMLLKSANDSFSASNNFAARKASGDYLFFLNNDIVFGADILGSLVEFLEREPSAGPVCPLLLYPPDADPKGSKGGSSDGTGESAVQHAGIRFHFDHAFNRIRPFNLDSRPVGGESSGRGRVFPAVTGAAMMCRKEEFFEIGGFCESYNYGMEDVDLCLAYLSRLGRTSRLADDLVLLHAESATQRTEDGRRQLERRKGNWNLLDFRYGRQLTHAIRRDRFAGDAFWSDGVVRAGFCVTEAGEDAKAGDYFTALELAEALEGEFGWQCRFLARNEDWYDVRDVDLLVAMIDAYDLSRIRNAVPGLVKVAWARNWFDRWAQRPWLDDFDLILCSCAKGVRFIESGGLAARLFPIAANADRFGRAPGGERAADIRFTGHKWGVERDVERMLRPDALPYRFEVFGAGWEGHEKFGPHWRGFVPYRKLPEVYAEAKIVIDDAVNGITRQWGSVNSRVFDALAAGALVITNGVQGAMDLFEGRLPSYETAEELRDLLDFYMEDDSARERKAKELNALVLERHTYRRRAVELGGFLNRFCRDNVRIAIKTPVPDREAAPKWGDFHFAAALKRALVRKGHSVRIDLLPDWDTPLGRHDDAAIVLRGLSRYKPRPEHVNIMWNISHADDVPPEEFELYDHVFVASEGYAKGLSERIATPVSFLPQCTDPARFFSEFRDDAPAHDVLFVGNSRKQRRPVVHDAIEAGLSPAVYGSDWQGMAPEPFVVADRIPNEELRRFYSSAKIVLNDHWPFMRDNGFVSNRIFDAGACGACVVSDAAEGLEELFGDAVSVYRTPEELKAVVERLLSDERERRRKGEKLRDIVAGGHRFSDRAEEILEAVERHSGTKIRRFPDRRGAEALGEKRSEPSMDAEVSAGDR